MIGFDPEYTRYVSGYVQIKAIVYDQDWKYEEYHTWSVSAAEPDLIAYHASVSDLTVDPGQSVTVYWTAKNQGTGSAGSTQQGVMWSSNSTISRSDTLLEKKYLGSMNIYETFYVAHTINIPANATPGQTYYLGAYADYDLDESESNEINNGSNGVAVIINYPPENITTPNTPSGPSSGYTGQSLSFATGGSISNIGHSVQYSFDWGDGSYSSWGSATQSTAYSNPGSYSIKAKARCQTHTLVVSNWSDVRDVSISGKPDLEITSIEINDNPAGDQHFSPGENVALGFQGHNDGNAASNENVEMTWYYGTSSYSKIHYIGAGYLEMFFGLSVGEYEWEKDPSWNVPITPGTYYLTAVIDSNNNDSESNEDNNERTLRFIVDQPLTNSTPNIPSDPFPVKNAKSITISTYLSWTGGDPDSGDTVTYDVDLGTDSGSLSVVSSNQTELSFQPTSLSYNTTYYWKIVAKDNHGAETSGPLWIFTTTNYPVAVLSVVPPNITNQTGISMTVGGEDVVAYKYNLDALGWSSEFDASSTIGENGLSNGNHTIKVLGKNSNDDWQPEDSASMFNWTVDTTNPQITIFTVKDTSTQSDQLTNSRVLNITFDGSDNSGIISRWLITETSDTPTVDQMNMGSNSAPASYTIQSAGDGEKTLYCWIMDAATNIGLSAQATITLDTSTTVAINDGNQCTLNNSIVLTGTREDGITVSVNCSSASVGNVSYPATGTWQVEITQLSAEDNVVTASITDNAGNQASDQVNIRHSVPATATIDNSGGTLIADGSGTLQLSIIVKDGQDQSVCDDTPVEVTTTLGEITPTSYKTINGQVICQLKASIDLGTADITVKHGETTLGTSQVETVPGPIAKLAFITPEQNIDVNTISSFIKVQTQDILGHPVAVDANIGIQLSSSSPDDNTYGFYTCDASWKYEWNKGDQIVPMAIRNDTIWLKYRDSHEGVWTLTATELGLPAGQDWTDGTQQISVSTGDGIPPVTTAQPVGGIFNSGQQVTLNCDDGSGCKETHFTDDGSEPSIASAKYAAPISIDSDTTLKFFSVDNNGNQEEIKTESYSIDTVIPSVVIIYPQNATVTQLLSIQGTAFDQSGTLNRVELQITDGTHCITQQQWITDTPCWVQANGTNEWSFNTSIVNWAADSTYTITARAIDMAGNISDLSSVDVTFQSEILKTYTTLLLDTSSQTIRSGDTLNVFGKLTRLPSGADLQGLTIKLTVTDPDGSTVSHTTTTYDSYGHYKFQDVLEFSKKGIYNIKTNFDGTNLLYSSESDIQTILVGSQAGYAVIIQGKINNSEGLASHNKTVNRIYKRLKDRGFADENIFYFNYDATQDGVDEVPDKIEIQNAIEAWATDKMNASSAPLFIIMVDHGNRDKFYIDDETITSSELKQWLDTLESKLSTEALLEKRIIIIGACYSGSFISDLSKQGRVIVTSAAKDEESYKGPKEPDGIRSGEFFMEELFQQLWRGYSLKDAFSEAAKHTKIFTRKGGSSPNANNPYFDRSVQHPLLDDDANKIGSNMLSEGYGDGQNVTDIYLGVGVTYDTNSAENPAELTKVVDTIYLEPDQSTALLWAIANDDSQVGNVWMEIRPPSKTLTSEGGSGQLSIDLNKEFMTLNESTGQWENTYSRFNESGMYEIFYFVHDSKTDEISPMKRSVVYKGKTGNNPPSSFGLVTPYPNAEVKTILLFAWQDSTDPDGDNFTYNVVISTDSDFNNVTFKKEGITVSNTYIDYNAGLNVINLRATAKYFLTN